MKVRIASNKIRFRLKEPEVREFEQKGSISEVLEFGNDETDQLKFRLAQTKAKEISIKFAQNETTVFVPEATAHEWTFTELVGFEAEANTGKGKIVSILIEKDFVCMDGREEENVGSYPNPLAKL